jgi:type III restriction enzyme
VAAFAKNYLAVGFKLDYVKTDGDLSTYTPDFIVRADDGSVTIVETKGREELDLPRKMARLAQWCEDATSRVGQRTALRMSIRTGSTATRRAVWPS